MPLYLQGDADGIARQVLSVTEIHPGDAAALVEIKRADIVTTTGRGLDANDAAFAPYSDKGPIYIDLGGSGGGSGRSKRAAALRSARRVGRRSARVSKGRRGTPVGSITPGGRLKAKSWAWFKHSWLGRSAVDLFGARAPHMIQSIVSRVSGKTTEGVRAEIAFQNPEKEEIASGHMDGAGRLPRRRFFEFGRNDGRELSQRWSDMIFGRLRR